MYNYPLFAPKQTSARIDFLRLGGRLVAKKALIMLNFLLKTRQSRLCCVHMQRQWWRKACTLTTANASSCRACCPRLTETTLCKHRNNLPLATNSQLVENTLNNFHQVTFWGITTFWHRQVAQDFRFYRLLVQYFVHERSVYLGLASQRKQTTPK